MPPSRPQPESVRLIADSRWLLANRSVWIWAMPVVSFGAAVSELALLVSLVQAILALVNGAPPESLELGPISWQATEGELLLFALAASTVTIMLNTLDALLVGKLSALAARNARSAITTSYFGADWSVATETRSGRLQQTLGINVQMASNLLPLLSSVLTACTSLLVYGTFVIVMSPIVALAFAALSAFAASVFSIARRRTRALARRSQALVRDVQLSATSLHSLNRELHLFNVQAAANAQMERLNQQIAQVLQRLRTAQRLIPSLFQQTVLLSVVVLIAIAGYASIDMAALGSSAIIALRSLSYVQQLNAAGQRLIETYPYIEEMIEFVDERSSRQRRRGQSNLRRVEALVLEDVRFSYGDTEILRGVNLQVEAGDWVGLIGPSGAGKSTLANVIAGLLEPTTGAYRVNGENASDFAAADWASNFSVLSQEPVLMRASIRDNISFFRDAQRSAIETAAEDAAILAEIRAFEAGFDTEVGEDFKGLSGGQKQRIGLARALYNRPSVLILDEPTSALDERNEALIEQALSKLDARTIVLVVSHRPALLHRCDRIFTVQDGFLQADVEVTPGKAAEPS